MRKKQIENVLYDSMGTDSHLGNPPYRGDLHQYILQRQEEEKEEDKKRKVSSILDEAILHLENLMRVK